MMQLQRDFVRIRYRVPAPASSQLRRAVCLQGVDDGRQDRGGWRQVSRASPGTPSMLRLSDYKCQIARSAETHDKFGR